MLLTDKRGTKQSVKEPEIITMLCLLDNDEAEKRRNAEKNFHSKIII